MDMSERDKLIVENQQLVFSTLHKYYPRWAYDEDMQQVGMIGLCKAADSYNPEKGKFSTLAVKSILGAIRNELRYRSRKQRTYMETSLSTVITDDEDAATLEDCLSGEDDVDYCDREGLFTLLTPTEQKLVELIEHGFSQRELCGKLNLSEQRVSQLRRQIQHKWRKYYAN